MSKPRFESEEHAQKCPGCLVCTYEPPPMQPEVTKAMLARPHQPALLSRAYGHEDVMSERRITCQQCQGGGRYIPLGDLSERRCEACKGHGYLLAPTCPTCDGRGHLEHQARAKD